MDKIAIYTALLALLVVQVLSKPYFMDNEWYDAEPAQNASIIFKNARFTMLTSRLIRMECSQTNRFDDRPSFVFINRNMPVPKHTYRTTADSLEIKTEQLLLKFSIGKRETSCDNAREHYDQSGGQNVGSLYAKDQGHCCHSCDKNDNCTSWVFGPQVQHNNTNCWLMSGDARPNPVKDRVFGQKSQFCNGDLSITLLNGHQQVTWTPKSSPRGNTNGTIPWADCTDDLTCEQCLDQYHRDMSQGLISQDGWVLVQDQVGVKYLVEEPYPWYETNITNRQDWYFFGYGQEHKQLLMDYTKVAGKIAMPPLNAFGVWWSRWYRYSEELFMNEIIGGYAEHGLPLNVVVFDCDWHTENDVPGCVSWGGFTWNETLFPNPQKFSQKLHSNENPIGHPLQLSLNLHPSSGVDHCQEHYAEFARLMGKDPSTNETIPCEMSKRKFIENLFKVYLDNDKLGGTDYWWTDYFGSGPQGLEIFWSNYAYSQQYQLNRNIRPTFLTRYGGLGNHRYPIGFSGDTKQAFYTLKWQLQMTPVASNVLFSYWSHDVGGFKKGSTCPGDEDVRNKTGAELLLRWVQFGALSPIFRTHCMQCERRIWLFPYYEYMKDAMLLRNALVPYIYTMSRIAYDTGISLLRPMYYDNPKNFMAYQVPDQYWFGESILAAPITNAVDSTGRITWPVWLPGPKTSRYMNWNGTTSYHGDTVVDQGMYDRSEIPLFVRADHIIPTRDMKSVASKHADPIVWVLYLHDRASGQLYEDDGESLTYKTGNYAVTKILSVQNDTVAEITIKAPVGQYVKALPKDRAHVLQIRGAVSLQVTKVECNGQNVPAGETSPGFYWNKKQSLAVTIDSLIVNLPRVEREVDIHVTIQILRQ